MSLPDGLSYIWLPEEQETDILYQLEYNGTTAYIVF